MTAPEATEATEASDASETPDATVGPDATESQTHNSRSNTAVARTDGGPGRRTYPTETTVIARTVTRIVFLLILLTAIALLLQGHNRPGGGFIAGVLTAAGVGLVYIIYGLAYLRQELLDRHPSEAVPGEDGREFVRLFAGGLALAALGGIVAMALGYPFLTQAVAFLEHLPVYGDLELASALVFDLGVYFVVVGSLLTILAVVGAE